MSLGTGKKHINEFLLILSILALMTKPTIRTYFPLVIQCRSMLAHTHTNAVFTLLGQVYTFDRLSPAHAQNI